MKSIVIDDEKAMHLVLKRMLAKIGQVEVLACFQDTAAASEYMSRHYIDLVFVDITMPKESGLEFVQRLRLEGNDTKVVFITSHKAFALDAFDVTAFDYLVKPVVFERLQRTVERARALSSLQSQPQSQQAARTQAVTAAAEIRCLGGVDMKNEAGARVKWKSSKSVELLAYLLLHQDRLVSRARLLDDIFGDVPYKNAATYLNTTVYQLRKALELVGLRGCLHSDNYHFSLHVRGSFWVDFIAFEEGCTRLGAVDDTQLEEAAQLERLYAGPLFGEQGYAWAWSELQRLELMYVSLTQQLTEALLRRGDLSEAVRLLTKLAALDELNEKSMMLLMTALALQKNKEALSRHYQEYTEHMRKELGMEPSHEVVELYASLQAKCL
ncbi:response regulator [Paenibacillus sp. YYML68]|uniref:response regulator n=1 Tax=Paenibacillus sp. YYML68 TaxID=2909250 RepID=UPI002491F3A4|nr:response regulator [Paenibacillus sp. YYML68]